MAMATALPPASVAVVDDGGDALTTAIATARSGGITAAEIPLGETTRFRFSNGGLSSMSAARDRVGSCDATKMMAIE